MVSSTEDLLSDLGGASAKFPTIGTTVGGRITATAKRQARDFSTGQPATWDDGSPQEQVCITVQTTERDPGNPDDDGQRTIYVKWWGDQRDALRNALTAAKARGVVPGGEFTATYVGDGEVKQRGFNAPKLFKYVYAPPNPTGDLTGQAVTAPQSAPPAATAQAPIQVVAQVPAAVTPPTQAANGWPPPSSPAAPSPAPTVAAPPPPPPSAPPAAAAPDPMLELIATIKAHQAAGWSDHDLATHPSSPLAGRGIDISAIAAVRNAG